jgi:hypothetical protein
MNLDIPIDTNLQNFFQIYLDVLGPVYKLKKREKEVMSAFLKVYYTNRGKDPKMLNDMLFDRKVRKALRDSIAMSEPSFNNHLVQLRIKKALIGNSINSNITKALPKDGELNITYKINIV